MTAESQFDQLLRFFKALSEPSRLKIVGILARGPSTVEELARQLHLSDSTVSHHLSRLSAAGLVRARAEGYYSVYALETEVLTSSAKALLREAEKPRAALEQTLDQFDRKVLETFTDAEGRIKTFPVQEKKFLVLIRHVLKAFDQGVRYPEKRVNDILANFSEDTARLRRALVDYRFMRREGGGGKYWRIDGEQPE
jgi:DNA-binding HxlR family transcriptional regulator